MQNSMLTPVMQAQSNVNQFLAYKAGLRNSLHDGNRAYVISAQHNHISKSSLMHEINRANAIASGQNAIKGSRRATALDVSEHYGAGFKAGAVLDFMRQHVADSAKAHVAKLVFSGLAGQLRPAFLITAAGQRGAFGHYHHTEKTSA